MAKDYFRISKGLSIDTSTVILYGSVDPSAEGFSKFMDGGDFLGKDLSGNQNILQMFSGLIVELLDDAGTSGGGIVEVPAGQFRINGNLSVPANVTLQGIYRIPPTTGPKAFTNLTGSVLFAYSGRGSTNSKPFIHFDPLLHVYIESKTEQPRNNYPYI